jgi:hypothetical protein
MNTKETVNHPGHYNDHPSGVECITVAEHMGFNLGNALKYIWRADLKENAIEDLRKAAWYIERELQKRGATPAPKVDHDRKAYGLRVAQAVEHNINGMLPMQFRIKANIPAIVDKLENAK